MNKLENALSLLGIAVSKPFKMRNYQYADDSAQYFVDCNGDVYEIVDISDDGIWETTMADFNLNDLFLNPECINQLEQDAEDEPDAKANVLVKAIKLDGEFEVSLNCTGEDLLNVVSALISTVINDCSQNNPNVPVHYWQKRIMQDISDAVSKRLWGKTIKRFLEGFLEH